MNDHRRHGAARQNSVPGESRGIDARSGREPGVIVAGSINVDFLVRAGRWPGAGETIVTEELLLQGGGKAANQALCAERLGARASLFGRIGDDELSGYALYRLRAAGMDLRGVESVAGTRTGTAFIIIDPSGEKRIFLAAGANDRWDDGGAALEQTIREADDGTPCLFQLEMPVEIVQRAARAARSRGLPVILDPSPVDRMPDALFSLATYLTPNETEAEALSGIAIESVDHAFRAGDRLVERGVDTALIKLGASGAAMVRKDGRSHIAGFAVEAVDTTGAGDAFAGALGTALAQAYPPADAVRFAVAASALAVTRLGAQASLPDRAAVEELLAGAE